MGVPRTNYILYYTARNWHSTHPHTNRSLTTQLGLTFRYLHTHSKCQEQSFHPIPYHRNSAVAASAELRINMYNSLSCYVDDYPRSTTPEILVPFTPTHALYHYTWYIRRGESIPSVAHPYTKINWISLGFLRIGFRSNKLLTFSCIQSGNHCDLCSKYKSSDHLQSSTEASCPYPPKHKWLCHNGVVRVSFPSSSLLVIIICNNSL